MIPESAGRIATLLAAHPVRGTGPYPIGDIVRALDAELAVLRATVAATPGPLGTIAPQLALLMMCLQHVVVLCHGFEDLPDDLRAQARRELTTAHQTARKLR
ncbi:hypothetical protein [Kutzneria sp. CA-103260]|uniref:hypothetical protein n=1 Tax=Kutzneria sp. CA-103260 TaxID=2802641 RepID=UPI001BAD131C|nr:hypothetical protein [Kutzneria sp. CA-103260]QUQ63413.1 hypothetical protein JJ691_11250 [Kutzneria sp. CA-103260]